jgi:hypothetical protein
MVGRTPTRITAGRPTGMNEMDCIRAMIRAINEAYMIFQVALWFVRANLVLNEFRFNYFFCF